MEILQKLNYVRVWPTNFHGFLKKGRFILRQQVKSDIFDSLMTFFVILNTIVLSMNQYGLTEEMDILLEIFNLYFTWIFIFEMSWKILAIGINKYVADKMNCLDGFVVILSVIELIAVTIVTGSSGEGNNLSAFKTVRMLRVFRVFRIGRILRAL
jgi:hypothetical protein